MRMDRYHPETKQWVPVGDDCIIIRGNEQVIRVVSRLLDVLVKLRILKRQS